MSTTDLMPPSPVIKPEEPRARRFTRDEYYRMADIGLFEDRRVELIDGEIIEMPAQRNDHAVAIELGSDALRRVFGAGYRVRVQLPFHARDGSAPEPDFAVIQGSPRDSKDHPQNALLIVEVADTTLIYDRVRKSPLYAMSGVQEYWIVNLVEGLLEVRRNPQLHPVSGGWKYSPPLTLLRSDFVSPLAAPDARIPVGDLLP